jgi:hypothetical protein
MFPTPFHQERTHSEKAVSLSDDEGSWIVPAQALPPLEFPETLFAKDTSLRYTCCADHSFPFNSIQ